MAHGKHLPNVDCRPFVRLADIPEHGTINYHYVEVIKGYSHWRKSAWPFQMKAILPLVPVKAAD
jgi:hypothetical protein